MNTKHEQVIVPRSAVKLVDGSSTVSIELRCDDPYYARLLYEDINDRLARGIDVSISLFAQKP